MSDGSKIEWTDATWNPVRGCTKVSPGCKHCYAETFAERFRGVKGHPFEQGFDLRLVPEKLDQPLRWKKGRRIFVNSMSDLFHEGVPDTYIDRVFGVMWSCLYLKGDRDGHVFQVLTKRAERMRAYMSAQDLRERHARAAAREGGGADPDAMHDQTYYYKGQHPRIWLGVSVENQQYAAERIPLLLQTPAAVRFLSVEPLLGPVKLKGHLLDLAIARPAACVCGHGHGFMRCPNYGRVGQCCHDRDCGCTQFRRIAGEGIHQVIIGGESGPGARACDVQWIRSLVGDCQATGTAAFVKQLGGHAVLDPRYDRTSPGWTRRLADRKGGDMEEWPEDLRVREWPGCSSS